MGCGAATQAFYAHIPDQFPHIDDVNEALKQSGMLDSQLIIGIDFSRSNQVLGAESFDGEPLHKISRKPARFLKECDKNPYQVVFGFIKEALAGFDSDQLFPVYGFGDSQTGSSYVFSFQPYDEPVPGLEAAVERYKSVAKAATPSGPTSFAPLIRQAILKCREAAAYAEPVFHLLVILIDGQISQCEKLTTEMVIEEASHYPLIIICIGVGDGPWDTLKKYDDKLRRRCFHNFQFVEFEAVFNKHPYMKRHDAFATEALMLIPAQFAACRALGYLKNDWTLPAKFKVPPKPFGPPDEPNVGDPLDGVMDGWTAVHHHVAKTFYYMNRETGETLWEKPVLGIQKAPEKRDKWGNIIGAPEEDAVNQYVVAPEGSKNVAAATNQSGSLADVVLQAQRGNAK